jgi:hypothetical protein
MKKITIHSDGYGGKGSVVLDEDGKEIESVRSATIFVEAGEITRADLTVNMVNVVVQGEVDTVTAECPICKERMDHKCGQFTLGNTSPINAWTGNSYPLPVLPQGVTTCQRVMGTETCSLPMSLAHTIHVNFATAHMWSDISRTINPGIITLL